MLYKAVTLPARSCHTRGRAAAAGTPRTAGQSGGAPGCGASSVASSSPRLHTSLANAACAAGVARPTCACNVAACTPGAGAELPSSADRPASVSKMRPSSPSRTLLQGRSGRSAGQGHELRALNDSAWWPRKTQMRIKVSVQAERSQAPNPPHCCSTPVLRHCGTSLLAAPGSQVAMGHLQRVMQEAQSRRRC